MRFLTAAMLAVMSVLLIFAPAAAATSVEILVGIEIPPAIIFVVVGWIPVGAFLVMRLISRLNLGL